MRENLSKHPHPHLLQAQKALGLLLSKAEEHAGTERLPCTMTPLDHTLFFMAFDVCCIDVQFLCVEMGLSVVEVYCSTLWFAFIPSSFRVGSPVVQ